MKKVKKSKHNKKSTFHVNVYLKFRYLNFCHYKATLSHCAIGSKFIKY